MSGAETEQNRSEFPFFGYLSVALVSGGIIAYELFVMRVFSNGGWSHFGSTVISIAMFGFGLFSALLCVMRSAFTKRLSFWINISLFILGPAMLLSNAFAQRLDFNPIFLVSDPKQKISLACYFLLYFIPFVAGAMFLGLVFLKGQGRFGRVYFANMCGSGVGGLVIFLAMYALMPDRLWIVPLAMWFAGALAWQAAERRFKWVAAFAVSAAASVAVGILMPQINVSPYKGVSYANRFPDAKRVYRKASPFGYMEIYSSSYFHFAPGLSDVAGLYLDEMPQNAYLGMYFDGDGPSGIMKALPEDQAKYFYFLPITMPYLLKPQADVFVMQFGGGISTNVALNWGANSITVAEGNPMAVSAIRDDPYVSEFTGNILSNNKVSLIPSEGRLYLNNVHGRFDVIDLSLADSTGLSMPGGFSIRENYTYTEETFANSMAALRPDGILAVTIWNKEDPPKSTLRLISTMVRAAEQSGEKDAADHFFISHMYLSTLTVLYKKNGFTPDELAKLRKYNKKMCFEVIYDPSLRRAPTDEAKVYQAYDDVYFAPNKNENLGDKFDMSAGRLYAIAVERIISGRADFVRDNYVFNIKPLTNDSPYFAGYVKVRDIPRFLDKLEVISDEWGFLLLWATLAISLVFGLVLMLFPVVFGWRIFTSGQKGTVWTVLYFICLGLGYIFVEIGMISKFVLCLGNPTVSVSVLITGMLIFSGIGSFFSERCLARAGRNIAIICVSIAALFLIYVLLLDKVFMAVGAWPYPAKIIFCLVILFPPAFLMGFPFAMGMSTLARLKKEYLFVWVWGINGSFSVVGSTLVPIISVLYGLSTVLIAAAAIYLIALPAFFSLLAPDRRVYNK